MTRPPAVFLDLDGLLIDTERLGLESFHATADLRGVALDSALYLELIGISGEAGMPRFRERLAAPLGGETAVTSFIEDWTVLYRTSVESADRLLLDGATALLDRLRRHGTPTCLVTNSTLGDARWKLGCAGIADRFDAVVTVDDVPRGKPDPGIYRHAAARLGVDPLASVALEDSAQGVAAALGAGMRVLQVCNLAAMHPAHARLTVLSSLHDASAWFEVPDGGEWPASSRPLEQ